MPKPMPAARMARKPAQSRRLAFGAMASLLVSVAHSCRYPLSTWLTLRLRLRASAGQLAFAYGFGGASLLRQVLDEKQAGLAGHDDIEIAVAVDIA